MRQRRLAAAVLAAGLALGAHGAVAAPVDIVCERETNLVPGWTDAMTISYRGEASGTLEIKSKHIAMTLPASQRKRPEDSALVVSAAGDTAAVMPDLVAVEACAAKKVPRDLAGDPDVFFTASLSCLGSVPAAKAPVPIRGSVSIGIVPPSDVIVEIRQTYAAQSSAPGGKFVVESFPVRCTVKGR